MRKFRIYIQLIFAAITNGYIIGFINGKIFRGNSKILCVPGLNCYSCPGALGSCPIGAMQAVIGNKGYKFSFYVVGLLMFFGAVFGRFVCGFLCPFGLIQDLLYKFKVKKITVNKKIDKPLRYLKYIILVVFVLILPLALTNILGNGDPYFCKLICPAGTVEAGFPLVLLNKHLQENLGFLFGLKSFIAIVIILLSMFVYRPFCKYLCPLGAAYSIFNKISVYQMHLDKELCVDCKACERACKMNVEVTKNINSIECIRCQDCVDACKYGAITSGFDFKIKDNIKVKSKEPSQN